jgi:hypothetical protein
VIRSLLALCCIPGVVLGQRPPARPRLVVVIVIDQFRPDYLQRFRPNFGLGGFNLFLRRGAHYTEAAYQHATTLTCPGHAAILTGTHANVNGIVANQWYDRTTRRQEYCAADSSAGLIGSSLPGRSPRNLIGSTVGDELRRSNGRSRVITIAGKDRSAIMLGGHRADAAYWMEDSLFVTSTYYMNEVPGWVQRFNASGRVSGNSGKSWDRLLPRAAYAIMGPDDVAAEENVAGMGRVFPHPLPPDSSPRFADAFRSSPYQDEVLLEFARAAVEEEHLGQDDAPDLLGISLSANDLIGHAYGPNSHELMDVTVRTDRLLGEFFRFLDRHVGLGQVLMVLTADHGVAPLPEMAKASRAGGRRLDPATIAAAVDSAMRARFGSAPAPSWLIYMTSPWIYLNLQALQRRGISIQAAENTARDAVRRVPGVHRAFTATELRRQRDARTVSGPVLSFYPDRSGNIYYELKPFVIATSDSTGTTHGSPWSYDTRVPLLWLGAAVKRGTYRGPASIADVAPTLSFLLGVDQPADARGRVLSEMLR